MKKIYLLCILILISCDFSFSQSVVRQYFDSASNAYYKGDYKTFLSTMQIVDQYAPNHPTVLYNLSIAYGTNDLPNEAINHLERLVWMYANYQFENDTSFNSINQNDDFDELVKLKERINEENRVGEEFLEIDKNTLAHPEGIAFDPNTQQFYIGDVRNRKIFKVSKASEAEEFAKDISKLSVMGMQVDTERNYLWVSTTPAPEMLGYERGFDGKAEVLCIDLETEELIKRYERKDPGIWFGDLTIHPSGDVYISSSSPQKAAIYRIKSSSDSIELFLDLPELISIQGLAFNENGSTLFFADYKFGLFRTSMDDLNPKPFVNYSKHFTKGIDGIYFYDNKIIAVHNGLNPVRIVEYSISDDELAIEKFKFLDKALPEMKSPTLGVIHNKSFYYIVNSPWAAYDKDKNLNLESVDNPKVFKISLK